MSEQAPCCYVCHVAGEGYGAWSFHAPICCARHGGGRMDAPSAHSYSLRQPPPAILGVKLPGTALRAYFGDARDAFAHAPPRC